jgi:transcriptional regulator with XRE-family HTH domain
MSVVYCILFWQCHNEPEKEAKMLIVVYIGEKLKATRTRRLLTQEELAERAGVSAATVVRVERDQAEPHFSTIRKLAKALGVGPTELLGE